MRPLRWPAGAILLPVLALPVVRQALESSMASHMLLQLPALVLAGALLGSAMPGRWRAWLQSFNAHGLAAGLVAAGVPMLWMIPRALDAAVADPWVDAAKYASLAAAGAGLVLWWEASAAVVQLFFVGNFAWMLATVGLLYQETPQRLCNAYLSADQQVAGMGLVVQALLVAAGWAVARVRTSATAP